MQQKKKDKQDKYKAPKYDEEEQQHSEEDDEEEEEEVQKKKKKKQSKKKKEEKKVEEDDEEVHDDDKYNINNALHPTAVLFHIAFKGGAAAMYLLGATVLPNQLVFISCVLLMSFDFWTVKNISGRLLVGLRWWSDYDSEGNEVWRFESPDERKFKANMVDKSFFWTGQFAITVFWLVFLVLNIISFGVYWGVLDFVGFSLASVNLYGFYKCSGEHQDKVKKMRTKLLTKGVMNMIG